MEIYRQLFGKRLKKARKAKDLTQEALGESVGVEPSTVSRWETGKDFPEGHRLPQICSALGVEQAYFEMDPEPRAGPQITENQLKDIFHSAVRDVMGPPVEEFNPEERELIRLFRLCPRPARRAVMTQALHGAESTIDHGKARGTSRK